MATSTAAVIGRVLQIRLHGELTLDSRQDPRGHSPPHGACLCLFRTARARSDTSWGSTSWTWWCRVLHTRTSTSTSTSWPWCRVLHAPMRVVFSLRRNWDAAYQLSEAQNPTYTVLIVDSIMHCTTIPSFALFFARVFFVEAPLFLTLSIISIECLMSRKGALLHFQAYLQRV